MQKTRNEIQTSRHKKILELVERQEIATQRELLAVLRKAGFDASQATVSRDVQTLQLTKYPASSGGRRYGPRASAEAQRRGALLSIFGAAVVSIEQSMNLLVLKTLEASASAVAEAIDRLAYPEVLGTIAGDNTVFVATVSEQGARETAERFRTLL